MSSDNEATSRVVTAIGGALVGALLGLLACHLWGAPSDQSRSWVSPCLLGGASLGLVLGATGGPAAIRFLWRVIHEL
jgi:hypothetical protein